MASSKVPSWLVKGCKVSIPTKGTQGTVEYIGATKFATGTWVGVNLTTKEGKHNGTLKGVRYFTCPDEHGVFARVTQVEFIPDTPSATPATSVAASPKAVTTPVRASVKPAATPIKVVTSPVKTVTTPVKAATAPVKTVTTPVKAATTPVKTVTTPVKAATTPVKTGKTPVKATTTPVEAASPLATQGMAETPARASRARDLPPSVAPTVSSEVVPVNIASVGGSNNEEVTLLRHKLEIVSTELAIAQQQLGQSEDEKLDMADEITELTLRCEIAEAELVDYTQGTGGELEKQNARLKEVVVQLRDSAIRTQRQLDSAEQKLKVGAESVSIATASSTVSDLEMIERLSTKNLELEEKNLRFAAEVEDLNKLVRLNDEIDAAHQENARELLADLDALADEAAEYQKGYLQAKGELSQYKQAIHKLREEAAEHAEELARTTAKTESDRPISLGEDGEVLDEAINSRVRALELANNAVKARSQAMELDLISHTASQAELHVEMVRQFLPQSFFGQESDGIQLVLLLARISKKCSIIAKETRIIFGLDDNLDQMIAGTTKLKLTLNQLSFAHDLVLLAVSIGAAAESLKTELASAEDSVYRQAANSFMDLKAHEGSVDDVLELIKVDKLEPSVSLTRLRSVLAQFERTRASLAEVIIPAPVVFVRENLSLLTDSNRAMRVELARIEAVYGRTGAEGSTDPQFGSVLGRIRGWNSIMASVSQLTRKAVRSIPDPSEADMKLPNEVRSSLGTQLSSCRSLGDRLREASTQAEVYIKTKNLSVDTAIKQAAAALVDLSENGEAVALAKAAGAEPAMMPLNPSLVFDELKSVLAAFGESLERGEYDAKVSSTRSSKISPPWEQRAAQMQSQISASLGLQDQLDAKEAELLDSRRTKAEKEKSIGEYKVKLSSALKHIDTVKLEMTQEIKQVKAALGTTETTLAEERRRFEQESAALNDEIAELDRECEAMKRKLESSIKTPRTNQPVDYAAAAVQIDAMQHALRAATAELATARGRTATTAIQCLTPIRAGARPVANNDVVVPEGITTASKEARSLLADLRSSLASSTVVDISKKGTTTSASGLAQRAVELKELRQRGDRISAILTGAIAQEAGSGHGGTNFGSFMSPGLGKVLGERKDLSVSGRVHIPGNSAPSASGVQRVPLDHDTFAAVHAVFAR